MEIKLSFPITRSLGDKYHKFKRPLEYLMFFLLFTIVSGFFVLDSLYPFNYLNLAMTAMFCIVLVCYILLFGEFYIDWFVFLLLIFWLTQIVATIVNLFPYFSKTGTLMAFLSIFIYQFAKQKFCSFKIIYAILSLSALVFLFAFLIKYFPKIIKPVFSQRIGTFFGNQNDVARNLSFSSLFLLVFSCESRFKWVKSICAFPILLCFYFIMLTGSISNLLVLLVLFLFFPFFVLKKRLKVLYSVIVIVLVIGFVAIINLPIMAYFRIRILNIINSFFGNVQNAGYDQSSVFRFRAAIYGFKMFLLQPFFGGGYSNIYRNYIVMGHNNIAEIMADFGIIGVLSYETMLIMILSHQKNKNYSVMLLILYVIVFQFFLVFFNDKITSIAVAICASNVFIGRKQKYRSENYHYVNI